jgi:GTP-binding protein
MDTDAAPDAIEQGRRIFAGDWRFIWAASSVDSLPPMQGVEIAFAGRSNVGKSSLINALTGRNALARTSHTPGRTQELIFFEGPVSSGLRLVDMPGYGFAAASKSKIAAWTSLIHDYLRGRANLARVYLLIDARHGLKDADTDVLKTLDSAAVSYQVILTKADQITAGVLKETIATLQQQLKPRPAAYPEIIATSSKSRDGIAELRTAIAQLLNERGTR